MVNEKVDRVKDPREDDKTTKGLIEKRFDDQQGNRGALSIGFGRVTALKYQTISLRMRMGRGKD